MKKRAGGILLHITSLPSKFGIGDLGPEAYKFVDFLVNAGQSYWQVLPLSPPTLTRNPFSPYNGLSAFAANPSLISSELLYKQGLLKKTEIKAAPSAKDGLINYRFVNSYKTRLFKKAFERFKNKPNAQYRKFCRENKFWLDDYANFMALRRKFMPLMWWQWPKNIRDKNKNALKDATADLTDSVNEEKFLQFIFFKQWFALKDYCNSRGIKIIGDIPIYVAYDSADVWSGPEMFKLTKAKKPRVVSGVPPDYFSKTGQLWGNPIYQWKNLKKTNYRWWMRRIEHNLNLFDIVRIDHFRGFVASWQVPANHKTAIHGRWMPGPNDSFFKTLLKHFPQPPIIVEDLGYITSDVRDLIKKFNFTSMKVLQFAFNNNNAKNFHCPHNYNKNCVVYTGTHDNNTTKGWFKKEITVTQKKRLSEYIDRKVTSSNVHSELMRLAMASVADTAIIPMQDVLGLDSSARMNRPGTIKGNWRWQLCSGQITLAVARKLKKLTRTYGRC